MTGNIYEVAQPVTENIWRLWIARYATISGSCTVHFNPTF